MDPFPPFNRNQKRGSPISCYKEEHGIGGDSNSTESGTSDPGFHIVKQTSKITVGTISDTARRLSGSFHDKGAGEEDVPPSLHSTTSTRANFPQFETPADETRNNFGPDDFDEQLFIGQLATNCTETRRFDEELEPPVIMDTADHSESSDVEDIFTACPSTTLPNQSEAKTFDTCKKELDDTATKCFPTSPTSDQVSRVRKQQFRSSSLGKRIGKVPRTESALEDSVASPPLILLDDDDDDEYLEEGDEENGRRLPEEDLSCDNALDTESIVEHNHHMCLNFNPPDEEEQSTSRSCTSAEGLKSTSPMRKRKGEATADSPEDTLPHKKPVTDDDVDVEFALGVMADQSGQNLDSPVEDRDTREEIFEVQEVSPYSYQMEDGYGDPCSSVPGGNSIRSIIPSKDHPPPRMGEWLQIFSGWSHPERLMAISELIGTCEATQVRHMMQIIEPQFQRDFISLLPKELALYVLSFLEPRDLLRAAQTCKYWRILADDNLLWREKCKEAGVGYFSAMSNRVYHRRNRSTTKGHKSTNNNSDVPNTRWKASFMKQHYVEMNWKRKDTGDHKILKGHDDHVITCLQFSGNRIVSGSDDNTLKVWSASNGKCLRTLLGHTGGVWSSQMSGLVIVSGSTDRTLRVWNAETGQCLHTLYGHTSTVRCMHLHGKKVVSGSRDATLRMWDVDTGECLHVLVGHMAAVRCVQYNGHLVVSGAYDYMVRIWDPEREECLHQLSGHTNRVYSLQFDGIHVVSGSLDTSIRVWDVETGACKHTLMGHQSLTSGMELRDNLLVSGNADSTVKIWDISTGQCLLTLAGTNKHLSAVTCLQLINKFVITSSDDGTVKLWDIRTGEFVRNLVSLSSGGSGGVVWRIRASETKLVCAVGSRNGTEETKLLVLDFDTDAVKCEPKFEPNCKPDIIILEY